MWLPVMISSIGVLSSFVAFAIFRRGAIRQGDGGEPLTAVVKVN